MSPAGFPLPQVGSRLHRAGLAVALLLALGIAFLPGVAPSGEGSATAAGVIGDVELYRHIMERTAEEGYYAAAIAELERHGFALSPFVVVRTPILASLGDLALLKLPLLVAVSIAFALLPGLKPVERVVLAVVTFGAGWHVFMPESQLIHDFWAGLLLALAFAIYRPGLWWPSLLVALFAAMLREIAVPFLFLALAFAVAEQRRREALGWIAALAVWACFMAWHAVQVGQHPGGGQQGWFSVIGPAQQFDWIYRQSLLRIVPQQLGVAIVALGLVGWLGLPTRHGLFAFLYLFGMTVLISVAAKFNNLFWIMLCLPMWFGGLVFVPRLLATILGLGGTSSQRHAIA